MFIRSGDLWTYPADWRVITTNGVVKRDGSLVMGAGVALQAAQRFPDVPKRWGKWVQQFGSCVLLDNLAGLIAFPTKKDWRQPSPLDLVLLSMVQLVDAANNHQLNRIVLPPVGCGNGGLKWADVEPYLSRVLDDRFTVLLKENTA